VTKITTLLFDIGDVLIDIDWQRGYKKMLGHMKHEDGRDLSLEEITEQLHPGPYGSIWDEFGKGVLTQDDFLEEVCNRTGYDGDRALLATALTEIFGPLPHRIELLNKIISQGKDRVALISDTNKMHMDYIEETIPTIFANIARPQRYYSYNLGLKKKLGKEIYEYVLKDMGITPQEALMIDDREQNKAGADAIDLNFLLVRKEEDLAALLCDEPYNLVF
jgi:FMN phosphatase YigB (HAD superfamily)